MKFAPIVTATLATGLVLGSGAIAQARDFYLGTATDGQPVRVDMDSIARASYRSVNFIYYLGDDRIFAQANCSAGSWITFPEGQVNYPQSRATQRMVNFVCRNGSTAEEPTSNRRLALVIDPPSNVRETPNGDIICALPRRTTINIYNPTGSWYRTDACGQMGFIHNSQIQFR
jgi:hypothetical protein